MSFWIQKRNAAGGRSLFSINMPILLVIVVIAMVIGILLRLFGAFFGYEARAN